MLAPHSRPPGDDGDLQKDLDELPEEVSDAKRIWLLAKLEREQEEARISIAAKLADNEKTATEIKSFVHTSKSRYDAYVKEIMAETEYDRLYEKLLTTKIKARLRAAF